MVQPEEALLHSEMSEIDPDLFIKVFARINVAVVENGKVLFLIVFLFPHPNRSSMRLFSFLNWPRAGPCVNGLKESDPKSNSSIRETSWTLRSFSESKLLTDLSHS